MDFGPYADWQRALEEAFFSPDWDGHPVVMYVDEPVAQQLQEHFRLAVPLGEAVRRVVRPGEARPYQAVERYEASKSAGSEDAPAVLPLLACSVVAATRMAHDGMRRASNYHSHFSELLAGREGVLTSADYAAVAEMWQRLASWQVQWGSYRGLCTIPSPGDLPRNQARIGYALSQAVLRGTDRQLLPKFFDVMRARNRGAWPQPGAALAQGARLWDQAAKFTPAFQRALDHPEFRPLVERLLGRLADVWDGSPHYVAHGTPRGELLVRFENRRLGWLARLPRPGADAYQLAGGVALRQLGETNYYAVDGLELPADRSLRAGVQLVGEGVAVSRPASSLVVLTQNESLDCRTSVDRFVPGEDHMVLAAPEAARDVEAVLEKAASPRPAPKSSLSWLPQGWVLYPRVVFEDAVTLKEAIRDVQGALLAVQPAPQFKAALQGGLLLAPKLSRKLYLAGGEPDLVLPDGASGAAVLDGQPQDPPFQARGVPIPLWPRGLEPGSHVLEAEGSVLAFATADGAPGLAEVEQPVGFAAAGAEAAAFASPGSGAGLVRGAGLGTSGSGAAPRVVLCRRRAQETVFASSDGRAWRIAEPATPSWWSRLPQAPSDYRFEVDVRAGGGWVLQLRQGEWCVEPAYPEMPSFAPGPEHRAWADAVLGAADAGSGELWDAFVDMAREAAEC
ncbi:hypothetical protein ABZ904_42610 [Streptomyces sp. NPDC046900]|uniref:hypothetical protein n=1 Tax=Streptomyces sp. NPDC046900 TaxID=3155473 RepID=UPI0033CF68A9